MTKYLLLITGLHTALIGLAQGDSLMLRAALAGDFSAWLTAQKSPGISAVWEPFATSTPPGWASHGDSAMWLFAQWAAPTIQYSETLISPDSVAIAPPRSQQNTYGWWIAFATGCCALFWQGWLTRRRNSGQIPVDLTPLHLYLSGDAHLEVEALNIWQEWSDSMTLDAQFAAALAPFGLTKTEVDVATKIFTNLSVQEIARDLNCTTAYVYNVRYSLRKKLNSDEDLPLERQLKKLME